MKKEKKDWEPAPLQCMNAAVTRDLTECDSSPLNQSCSDNSKVLIICARKEINGGTTKFISIFTFLIGDMNICDLQGRTDIPG